MKLIYAILHENDSGDAIEALTNNGFTVTRLSSTGGFLRSGNVTLLIGVEPDQVAHVTSLVKQHTTPQAPNQHAATLFVLDMPIYVKL